jgi:probable HAF family extracellular repeat protein
MEDLGTLPGDASSYASALNVFDIVVGTSTSSDLEVNRAFVWTKRTGMIDLNTLLPPDSGWTLTNATGINIFGQIVGNGTINGQTNAFLLTLK